MTKCVYKNDKINKWIFFFNLEELPGLGICDKNSTEIKINCHIN